MRKTCETIATYIFKKGLVVKEDVNALRFGLEVLINHFLSFGSIILIGIWYNFFFETLLYLVVFIFLRNTFDGYHANTFFACYLLTVGNYLCIVIMMMFIEVHYLCQYLLIFILLYLNGSKEQRFSKKKFIITLLFLLSNAILILAQTEEIVEMIFYIYFTVLLAEIIGRVKYESSNCR